MFYILIFISLFFKNILILFVLFGFLILHAKFKIKNISNYFNLIAKYFYFICGIFLSYLLIAILKKDFYIFIGYLHYSIVLSLKILLILLGNYYLLNDEKLFKKVPEKLKVRLKFLKNMYNLTQENLKKILQKYPEKISKIKNIDKIIVELIVEEIKIAENEKDFNY